ncbi:hypothetical protein [Desulfosarcina alkanivorans]|nr:hypothetical protein [Desulfosarcina alkanivorans]
MGRKNRGLGNDRAGGIAASVNSTGSGDKTMTPDACDYESGPILRGQ